MMLCLLERPRIRFRTTNQHLYINRQIELYWQNRAFFFLRISNIYSYHKNKNGIIPCIPSKDWQLNVFLDQLSKELTDEDFASLKFFCSEDGNDHVRFHVRGHRDKSAGYLQDLRLAVSRLLLCPPEYIYVAGCEEAESMWVTLLIPARCIDVLLNIRNDDWCVLKLLDVDIFVISKLNKEVRSPLIFAADCLEIPNIKVDSGKLTMANNRCGIVHTSDEHPELQNVLEKIRMYEHQQIQQSKETDKAMSPEKSKIHVTDHKNRQRRVETTVPTLPSVHEVTTSTDDARLLLVRETTASLRLHTDSGFQEEQIFSKRHGDLDQN